MKKIDGIKSVTVKYEDRDIVVKRSEMLDDPTLEDRLTSLDRVNDEACIAEYELKKLIAARRTLISELHQLTTRYVHNKMAPETEEDSNDK